METTFRGGFASVTFTDSQALKRYHAPGLTPGLLREVGALRRLAHRGVVRIVGASIAADGHCTVVLPRFECSLRHLAVLPKPAALASIARQLTTAVAYVHACGFIHRDVTPANALVRRPASSRPHVVLSDFNTATLWVPGRRMTKMVTTIPYAPPEMLAGEVYGLEADAWSLGITLLEAAVGGFVFSSREPQGVLEQQSDWLARGGAEVCPHPRVRVLVRRLTNPQSHMRPKVTTLAETMFNVPSRFMAADRFVDAERKPWGGALNERMRHILLDWLAEVCAKSFLSVQTLQLAAALVDATVAHPMPNVNVTRTNLQLHGCACLYLAAMTCEEFHLPVSDLAVLSDRAFTNEMAERHIDAVAAGVSYATIPPIPLQTARECLALFGGHSKKTVATQ